MSHLQSGGALNLPSGCPGLRIKRCCTMELAQQQQNSGMAGKQGKWKAISITCDGPINSRMLANKPVSAASPKRWASVSMGLRHTALSQAQLGQSRVQYTSYTTRVSRHISSHSLHCTASRWLVAPASSTTSCRDSSSVRKESIAVTEQA